MKVTKALIIRREGVQMSMDMAAGCAKSCDDHNLPWEFIDAVQFMEPQQAYKSVGSFMKRNWNPAEGNACCHSSHIKSWRRIVELNETCLILEHDSLVVGDCKTIDIPDMAAITYGFRVCGKDDYTPPGPAETLIELKRSVGVHACALTPVTAKWLLDDACQNGVTCGVDRWLFMSKASGLPVYCVDPPQAVCWVRGSSMPIGNKPSRGTPGCRNAGINLPPGWKAGLKKNVTPN